MLKCTSTGRYCLLGTVPNSTVRIHVPWKYCELWQIYSDLILCANLKFSTVGFLQNMSGSNIGPHWCFLLDRRTFANSTSLSRQCQRQLHSVNLPCQALTGQIWVVVSSTSVTKIIIITIWHKKQGRQPICVPSTELGSKGCSSK
jgi:hypothetical protein